MSNVLFVCEDESLYAIGHPFTYKKCWSGSQDMKKDFIELKKPRNCTDYLRIDASISNRLVLTKEGNLFCQGENLRLYIDEEVDKDIVTSGFVEITDVFPVEDQIVDCAASGFGAMIITDGGSCWYVGHDRYRS